MPKVVYSRDETLLLVGDQEFVFVPTPAPRCAECAFCGRKVCSPRYRALYWYECRYPRTGPDRKCRKTFRKDRSYGYWRLANGETQ